MKFLALCCSSVFLLALFEPIWCKREFMGLANHAWYNDRSLPGPIAVYRDDFSGVLILTSTESPYETIVWFALIDFSAQINNLVYLHVENQESNISLAFSNINAVHNIFLHLCPFSADQGNDILLTQVVFQLGDGTLASVGGLTAIDVHPLEETEEDYNRYVVHSRLVLAIRPDDGEGEIFYYGLACDSLIEKDRLVMEAVNHGITDIYIPKELDARFMAHFKGKNEIPPLQTQLNTLKGAHILPTYVA